MKFFYRIGILLLKWLASFRPLGAFIFRVLKWLPFERERRIRLESYIFGKVQLRVLQKPKIKKRSIPEKKRQVKEKKKLQAQKKKRRLAKEKLKAVKKRNAQKDKQGSFTTGSHLNPFKVGPKRWFYAQCIAVLAFCNQNGLEFIPRAVTWGLSKTKTKEARLDSVTTRIYGKENVPKKASDSEDIIHLGSVIADKRYNRLKSHGKLRACNTLHIFIEASASIPEFLASSEFAHQNFVIYSFNDQSKFIEKLGLEDRTRYQPLRDRFNEISPEGIELFDFCKSLGDKIFDVLQDHPSESFSTLSERQQEVMALGLDGRISSRLSLAACFREGLAEVPPTDSILFLALTDTYALNGWDFYKDVMPPKRSFVLFTARKLNQRHTLLKRYISKVSQNSKTTSEVSDVEKISDAHMLMKGLGSAFEQIKGSADRLVKSLGIRLENVPSTIIAHAESASNYKVTVEELARESIRRLEGEHHSIPVLLHCSGSVDKTVVPRLLKDTDHDSFVSLDLSALAPIITDNMNTRAESAVLIDWVRTQIGDHAKWQGADIYPMIFNSLAKFFIEQVHWITAGYSFGAALSDTIEIDGTLAMPSRHWLIRSVCAGLLDGSQGSQPLIDVQSLNILKHPKYRRPMANHCTVIDKTAQTIYRDYLGIPESQISVVGAPQNDNLQRNLGVLDKGVVMERMGLSEKKKTVVLISQLQPFERMRRIIAPLGELLRDNANLQLVIRMHPRETMERQLKYREELSQYVEKKRINLSIDEPAIEVLKIADVCVTIYSNMAREAAIAGIPVITVNYLGWEPPICLDAEGLARPSPTPKKLKRNVVEALNTMDEGDGRERSSAYMIDNPHILKGDSVKKIFEKFDELKILKKETQFVPMNQNHFFEGMDLLSNQKSIDLVMTADNRVADLPPLFKKENKLTVYNTRSDPERGFLPTTAVVDAGKFSKDVAVSVEAAIARGNQCAQNCLDVAFGAIKDWPEVHALLKPLEYSLWLRLRPRLLRPEIELANIDRGINAEGRCLVICSSSSLMLEFLLSRALNAGRKAKDIVILHIHKNLTYDVMTPSDFRKSVKHLYPKPPQEVSNTLNQKTQVGIRRWLKSIRRVKFEQPESPRLLITSDWALKTVPGTVAPVMRSVQKPGISATFANVRPDDLPSIKEDFKNHRSKFKNLDYMTPIQLGTPMPQPQGRHLKTLAFIWQNALLEDAHFKAAPPNIQRLMMKSMDTLGRIWLGENFVWEHYCRNWFTDSRAASLASPGRQWHAEIAHQVAIENDALAMTLQNAYMTAGYTYTKPTGNYVSAIDQWSKSVFMEAYGVPEENIYVTSTPRFDYLKDLTKQDPILARDTLSISPDMQVVFFAAQIGLEQEAEIVIRKMANLNDLNGRPVMGLVKLHPRTPLEDLQRYESYAKSENPDHNVFIHHEGDIADFLLASDVVITAYSNVGIEAAILGKPLIIAKLTEAPLPLPMDEFKIGYVAHTGDDISFAIRKFFTSETFLKKHLKLQDAYRAANPAMVAGNSTQIIAQAIDAALKSEDELDEVAE